MGSIVKDQVFTLPPKGTDEPLWMASCVSVEPGILSRLNWYSTSAPKCLVKYHPAPALMLYPYVSQPCVVLAIGAVNPAPASSARWLHLLVDSGYLWPDWPYCGDGFGDPGSALPIKSSVVRYDFQSSELEKVSELTDALSTSTVSEIFCAFNAHGATVRANTDAARAMRRASNREERQCTAIRDSLNEVVNFRERRVGYL